MRSRGYGDEKAQEVVFMVKNNPGQVKVIADVEKVDFVLWQMRT